MFNQNSRNQESSGHGKMGNQDHDSMTSMTKETQHDKEKMHKEAPKQNMKDDHSKDKEKDKENMKHGAPSPMPMKKS